MAGRGVARARAAFDQDFALTGLKVEYRDLSVVEGLHLCRSDREQDSLASRQVLRQTVDAIATLQVYLVERLWRAASGGNRPQVELGEYDVSVLAPGRARKCLDVADGDRSSPAESDLLQRAGRGMKETEPLTVGREKRDIAGEDGLGGVLVHAAEVDLRASRQR